MYAVGSLYIDHKNLHIEWRRETAVYCRRISHIVISRIRYAYGSLQNQGEGMNDIVDEFRSPLEWHVGYQVLLSMPRGKEPAPNFISLYGCKNLLSGHRPPINVYQKTFERPATARSHHLRSPRRILREEALDSPGHH